MGSQDRNDDQTNRSGGVTGLSHVGVFYRALPRGCVLQRSPTWVCSTALSHVGVFYRALPRGWVVVVQGSPTWDTWKVREIINTCTWQKSHGFKNVILRYAYVFMLKSKQFKRVYEIAPVFLYH